MKFYELINLFFDYDINFDSTLEPYLILQKINSIANKQIIRYEDFYLFKDREMAKKWFNALFNHFYSWEVFIDKKKKFFNHEKNYFVNDSRVSISAINKMIKIFFRYEELYPKYKAMLEIYDDNSFIKKIKGDIKNVYNENDCVTQGNYLKKIESVLNIFIDEFKDFFYHDNEIVSFFPVKKKHTKKMLIITTVIIMTIALISFGAFTVYQSSKRLLQKQSKKIKLKLKEETNNNLINNFNDDDNNENNENEENNNEEED